MLFKKIVIFFYENNNNNKKEISLWFAKARAESLITTPWEATLPLQLLFLMCPL